MHIRRIIAFVGLMFVLQGAAGFEVDALGVNVEACPMPGGPFVNGNEFPKGGNTNAYYWIDVVARDRDEKLVFRGDGPSNLPDPVFDACVGQTNRVILLIGKKYDISSAGGFDIVSKSSSLVQVKALPGGGSSVRFPVDIKMIRSWTKPARRSACPQEARSQTRKNDDTGKVAKQRADVLPTPEQEAKQKELLKLVKEAEEKARVRADRLRALEEARRPAFARQSASDILARPVVNVFGRKGIPKLPIDERSAFASNYVSTARLSTEEANVVFQELSR